jgi:hypothetical protein
MILTDLHIAPESFAAGTGWAIRPEGACQAELCVPLPSEARTGDDRLDVRVVAERLGMPLVHEATHGFWALGPETNTGRALATAQAPALELPDFDGNPFQLSSLRGQKVLLVAWASW